MCQTERFTRRDDSWFYWSVVGESNRPEGSDDVEWPKSAVDAHEGVAAAHEPPRVEPSPEQEILSNADERDVRADRRDDEATKREIKADLEDFLDPREPDKRARLARTDAATDRAYAKGNRTSSKQDREALVEPNTPGADDQ